MLIIWVEGEYLVEEDADFFWLVESMWSICERGSESLNSENVVFTLNTRFFIQRTDFYSSPLEWLKNYQAQAQTASIVYDVMQNKKRRSG